MDEAYIKILQMVEQGSLSAEEAEVLLDALESPVAAGPPAAPAAMEIPPEAEPPPPPGPPQAWKLIWLYPALGGLALLALTGVLTGNLIQGGQRLGWLACTIPLMLLGTLVAMLAWWSRTARWLHLHVRDREENVRISLPLPLRLTAWALRLLGPRIPKLRDTGVDEIILALADTDMGEGLLAVEVDDEEEGEHVRVYIG